MTQKNARALPSFRNQQVSIDSFKLPSPPFLYPILDCDFSSEPLKDSVDLIRAGTGIIQVRAKKWSKDKIFALISELEPVCVANSVLLIVNDQVDNALLTAKSGVHLGQDDFPVGRARDLLPDRPIGISTHNMEQFETANQEPVDYVAVGPIFATTTKQSSNTPLGLRVLEQMIARKQKPVVCIGGIKAENFQELVAAGVDGIALISELYRTGNVYDSFSRLKDALGAS